MEWRGSFMKIVKKIVYVMIFVIANLVMYSTIAKATTVTVTTETLNLRKKPSTSSEIVATFSEGVKCELLEESGDWYKVKYKTYTGYVSKEYVKKNEDTSKNDTKVDNDKDNDTSSVSTITQLTGKVASKSDVKIVPLIYSSNIAELDKNETVVILTEINGWSYIQTNSIMGWIRSNIITEKKSINSNSPQTSSISSNNNTQSATNTNQEENNNGNQETTNNTEKTMYINESSVNLRKEPNTSSKILMVVGLNQKLTIIGESGDWYQVKTKEGNAYVLKKLVSSKKVTTSRGGSLTNHTKQEEVSKTSQESTTDKVNNKVTTTSEVSTTNTNKATNIKKPTNTGEEVVKYAKKFLGVPYVYGGASKSGFDCSGFTMYVYKKFGISMRHGAQAQAKIGKAINANKKSASSLKGNLQPGDLVFFLDYETMDEIGHCGIYIGNGKFIHASSGSGYCVKINSLLPGEYYNTRYCAARRVL